MTIAGVVSERPAERTSSAAKAVDTLENSRTNYFPSEDPACADAGAVSSGEVEWENSAVYRSIDQPVHRGAQGTGFSSATSSGR